MDGSESASLTDIGQTEQLHQRPNTLEIPDLSDFLDADPRPTFIVPIPLSSPIPFDIAFDNQAFRDEGCAEKIQVDSSSASAFRSWCQALHWRKEYEYADTIWTAYKIKGRWKCVRSIATTSQPKYLLMEHSNNSQGSFGSENDRTRTLEDVGAADQRLATLYRMMEMSDVGTFEYNPEGKLLRANESWYRLSLHPRVEEMHLDFSFMDLVYPADAALVLRQWNTLISNSPITFEMRWKGKHYRAPTADDPGVDDYQWVLSACVPITDEQGNVVTIAGNTIDITAQKRVQDEAIQRAEALERAREIERRFARFASLSPIAIYILDPHGKMTFCNSRFSELAGHMGGDDWSKIDWRSVFFAGDQDRVNAQWSTLLRDKQHTQAHFRLQHTWNLGDGTERQAWSEHQTFPELDQEGNIISIFGTLTDISRFKWAEDIQRTRIEEALLAKQKHENFIDMTSHEMRNPLSAVIQCADSTIDSLKLVRSTALKAPGLEAELSWRISNEIRLSLDSLNTIISCSLHQKRVIDDILTLSKMDSNLLTIAPVSVEPSSIVSDAVHMFQVECRKDSIQLNFVQNASLEQVEATWVMLDPSRVTQVLINLLTNAIKFTRDRPTRNIEVTLGASRERPSSGIDDTPYTIVTDHQDDLLQADEWGKGPEVFITISVSDTGCGMSPDELSNLFTRFSQATPRTHIRYGGSGLGLFISKKLAELQGGAIGVRSQPDVGSTFSFFVAARVAHPKSPTISVNSQPAVGTPIFEREEYLSPPPSRVPRELTAPESPKYTILVVEDNVVNQKVLAQQLRRAGCEVHVANHGAEALAFLRRTVHWNHAMRDATSQMVHDQAQPPGAPPPSLLSLSLILMDIEMPIMDGLTCTQQIRALQASGALTSHIPIMAVSANARSEQVAQARAAGMDDAIAKPFRIRELMGKMEGLASQKLG